MMVSWQWELINRAGHAMERVANGDFSYGRWTLLMPVECHAFFASMEPRDVLLRWVDAFNRADVEALADLYHADAINHQVANEPVVGRAAIRAMFVREFAGADMVCRPENIFTDGEWAILEWSDPQGLRGCGFFHVVNGRILFQRGYWDKLSFLRLHGLPLPQE